MFALSHSLSSIFSSKSSLSSKPPNTHNGLKDFFLPKIRRGALVIYEIRGHKFERKYVTEPIKCSHCHDLIYIPFGQTCKLCKFASHTRCLDSIEFHCSKDVNKQILLSSDNSHKFEPKSFRKFTYCNQCGTALLGLYDQGLECNSHKGGCGAAIHYNCKDLVCFGCFNGNKSRDKLETLQHHQQKPYNDTSTTAAIEHPSRVGIDQFDILRILGTGSFSKVYLARFKRNDSLYALKAINKTNIVIINDPHKAKTEMNILNLGRKYPFLTTGHCCFQTKDKIFYVMEYVAGRDLFYHLHREGRRFSEDRSKFYAAEITLALVFLHKNNIVYRDLKLDNVLLDIQGHCKLLDFGMSKQLECADLKTNTFCGTPNYISPEIIRNTVSGYSFSVDWWSLGVLTFEMLAGYSPFMSDDDEKLYKMILDEDVKLPKFLSEEAKSFLDGLLTKDVHNRLGCQILEGGAQAVFRHPFFVFRANNGRDIIENPWEALETKSITPPYVPALHDSNINDQLDNHMITRLSITRDHLDKISQSMFNKFSFYSESFEQVI